LTLVLDTSVVGAFATLDERHLRVVRPLTGEAVFALLPTDIL
jgi:hypothetical protein